MRELGNLHKDMDTGIVHVVRHVLVCTMFCQVFPQWSNDQLFRGTIWKSSSSSSRYTGVLAGVAAGVGRVSPEVSPSADKLNGSCLHTGLGGVCNVFHGMTGSGSNKACLMLETW